jgi:hypothetical protein
MALLAALFAVRTLGQLAVTYGGVTFLPPVEQWQSGLLPYPALLASQAIILLLLALVTRDVWRGRGPFVVLRPRLGTALAWFSAAYALAMVVRYAVTMALRPEWRWFGPRHPGRLPPRARDVPLPLQPGLAWSAGDGEARPWTGPAGTSGE